MPANVNPVLDLNLNSETGEQPVPTGIVPANCLDQSPDIKQALTREPTEENPQPLAGRDAGRMSQLDRRQRWQSRKLWGSVLSVVALLAIVFWLIPYVNYRLAHSSTDDGFVESRLTHLGAQTAGLITAVLVEERDVVRAGELLAEVDSEPHQRALELATATRMKAQSELALQQSNWERLESEYPRKVAAAQADLAYADAGVAQSRTELEVIRVDVDQAVDEAAAAVTSARANLTKASDDQKRYERLYQEESITKIRWEEAVKALATADADMKTADAKFQRAQSNRRKTMIADQNVAVAVSRRNKADEELRLAELGRLNVEEAGLLVEVTKRDVEHAKRNEATVSINLEYCRMVAPFDGVVVKRYRNPGDHAPIGSPILSLYNPELIFVTAYLEEDRLAGVAPGNRASLKLDAFTAPLPGRVIWIGQATGANFSLVPRDVSSGEFTKVPQRIPVRILPDRDSRWPDLRPGLSVSVVIDHGPGDPAWATAEADRIRLLGATGVSPLRKVREEPMP